MEQIMLQQVQKTPRYEYAKYSPRSLGFPFQREEDSLRTRHDPFRFHMFRSSDIQALLPENYAPVIDFEQFYFRKCATDLFFPAKVLFTDGTSFTREEIFKTHMWAVENLHVIQRRAVQTRLPVNIWALVIGDYFIRPYVLSFCLTGRNY